MPPPKLLPGPGATPRRRQMHVGVGGPGAVFWMIVAGFLGMSSFRQGNQAPLPSPMTTENVTNRTVKATLKTVRKNGAGAGTRRPIVATRVRLARGPASSPRPDGRLGPSLSLLPQSGAPLDRFSGTVRARETFVVGPSAALQVSCAASSHAQLMAAISAWAFLESSIKLNMNAFLPASLIE